MNRVLVCFILLLCGCTPDLNGEYFASRKVLFFTQEAVLSISGDTATFTVDVPGTNSKATDIFSLKYGEDNQIALFKSQAPEDQLIFKIEDDGKKLVYQKTSKVDLPEVWIKKVKI